LSENGAEAFAKNKNNTKLLLIVALTSNLMSVDRF
jgi:hypothetical protein